LSLVARGWNGDHVLFDYFPQPNPGVKIHRDDVDFIISHKDIKLNLGEGSPKAGEERAGQEALGDRGHCQAQPPSRTATQPSHRLHHREHLSDRRRAVHTQLLSGFRQPDSSRCAAQQGGAKHLLQPPH
jgi:hypothetical protein